MIKSALIKLRLTAKTDLKIVVLTKILNSHHDLPKEENETETFHGLICRLAPTFRPTLAKYFCDS